MIASSSCSLLFYYFHLFNYGQFYGHLENQGSHLENVKNRVGYTGRFEEHVLKVSYLFPEVHICCENRALPAPLIPLEERMTNMTADDITRVQ